MKGYTMPFLWIANNDYEAIGREIEKIRESGSETFCVESRTHSDFCGPQWWEVMDFIVKKADSLSMRVWLLDDKHYPTGFANGAVERFPALRQRHIFSENRDLCGPASGRLIIRSVAEQGRDARLVCAVLLQKKGRGWEYLQDITSQAEGEFLRLSLPGGFFRVCFVWEGTGFDETGMFIDMLNPDSVQLLIDEVYAPHYERYKGTCFAGFFSDEPRFGNGISDQNLNHMSWYGGNVGILGLSYPWKDSLIKELAERAEGFERGHLAALWNDTGRFTAAVRAAYMDCITRAYAENFSGALSAWCHARGLSYASHIIEDMGAHAHTFCSAGHYFRSQYGADYAGVDVVLHQIKPFCGEEKHIAPIADGYADPLFFDNTLAKLASSCSHIDKSKRGALCEIFGAYGWAEGSEEMLWLANHMLVRGINLFIPHAFSSVYPNDDCPPYFYAAGENPAYPAYKILNGYIGSVCNALEGGTDEIRTAVLYHAEAEWSGRRFMPVDRVAKKLLQCQADFDIVPEDSLQQSEEAGALVLNGRKYDCLFVPQREYLSARLSGLLKSISPRTKVVFVGGGPEGFETVPLSGIAGYAERNGLRILQTEGSCPHIRARKVRKAGKTFFFIHNESHKSETIVCKFAAGTCLCAYDFLNSRREEISIKDGRCSIRLLPGQAMLFEICEDAVQNTLLPVWKELPLRDIAVKIQSPCDGQCTAIAAAPVSDLLRDHPEFCGYVTLEAEADLTGVRSLRISFSGEYLKAEIGNEIFERIVSPAFLGLKEHYGSRRIRFILCNNPAARMRDELSKYSLLPPTGIVKAEGTAAEAAPCGAEIPRG